MRNSPRGRGDWDRVTEMGAERAELTIWVATDGRLGNENPARGLAEAIARRRAARIELKTIHPKRWASALPPSLWAVAGARRPGWPFTALRDGGAALAAPFPDLVIGAGRKSAPITAALRKVSGRMTKAVQLMNPQMPFTQFDLICAPAHDRLHGPNVLTTVGSLNRIRGAAAPPADPRLADLGRPRLAVLIGGSSRSARMSAGDVDALIAGLEAFAARGAGVAATASPRTDPQLAARAREAVRAGGGWFWDGSGENPYLAMLHGADALLATADSVNMGSEAAATGKPVYIAPVSKLAPKLERFHAALRSGGHARSLAEALAAPDPFGWTPKPLDDVDRAAERVLTLWPRE